MIALEQARQHLETLGIKQAVEVLDNTPDAAASKQLPYPEMLAELLDAGVAVCGTLLRLRPGAGQRRAAPRAGCGSVGSAGRLFGPALSKPSEF